MIPLKDMTTDELRKTSDMIFEELQRRKAVKESACKSFVNAIKNKRKESK